MVVRFGFLALVAGSSFGEILTRTPIYADGSAWYASHALLPALSVLAVILFAFFTSLGGRRVFSQTRLIGLTHGRCDNLLRMREPLAQDTSPEAERVMLDIYRRMPVWRKMEMVDDAIRTGRQLAMAGLRARYPHEGLRRLHRRLYGITLGEELAEEAYGPLENIV